MQRKRRWEGKMAKYKCNTCGKGFTNYDKYPYCTWCRTKYIKDVSLEVEDGS